MLDFFVFVFLQMSSDLFFWGFVNNYVYIAKTGNRDHLEEIIQTAALLRNILQRAWLEVEYLMYVYRAPKVAHVGT